MKSDELYICAIMLKSPVEEDSYLNNVPAVKFLTENKRIDLISPVTVFVGENGVGKSTLIEAVAIAYGFNPEGGTKNFCFSTQNTHSSLYEHIRLSRAKMSKDGFFLRAESYYNNASYIDELDRQPCASPKIINSFGGISLHKQSHGESFLAAVQNRFGGNGIYILDEPEAALSPMRQLTLIREIQRLVKADSQFIISTHSPMLMAMPGADILEITAGGITPVDYRETEHYRVMKRFLEQQEKLLKYMDETET